MRDKAEKPKKFEYVCKYLCVIVIFMMMMTSRSTLAIQTHEVQMGHGGVYDGAVYIGRDESGRLIFMDQDLGTTVTLGELYHRSKDHDSLLGLADDDHPQYLLHTELDSPAELEAAIGEVDLISKTEGDGQYLRFDGTNGPLAVYNADRSEYGTIDYDWYGRAVTLDLNGDLAIGTDRLVVDALNGRVGVSASATPDEALLCVGDDTDDVAGQQMLRLNIARPWVFEQVGAGSGAMLNLRSLSINKAFAISTDGQFLIRDADGSQTSAFQVLPSSGRVGINKFPVCALDVSGDVAVTGDLDLAGATSRLMIRGRPVVTGGNLLDNPDFNIWQRNISQTCESGGDAGGTLTHPQPGTLVTGADRWQISRAGTLMSTVVSRQTPPAGLPASEWCLKQAVVSGEPCTQYLFQSVPREVTQSLRGGWVTFAVSHYLVGGSDGGTVAIYKTVSGAVTPLATYSFASTADTWERVAVAALVPGDAETLLVSIQSNLALSGPTQAYVANAVLVGGLLVANEEKVADPALSSVAPMAKSRGEDLAHCQRYFEKGGVRLMGYSPDTNFNIYATMVHYNTAKDRAATITVSNLSVDQLASPNLMTVESPAYSEGQSYPQGFRFEISGVTAYSMRISVSADWQAECDEPS